MIEKQAKTFLYQQLVDQIKGEICDGVYKSEDKLPTERELCKRYQISRATVHRALKELELEKIVVIRQGSGTYIAPDIFEQYLNSFYSFSGEMRKQGKKPSNQILSFKHILGPAKVCKTMALPPRSRLIRIIRLRLADKVPYFYETSYLPAARLQGLTQEVFEDRGLYDIMQQQQQYHISLNRAIETFRPLLPSKLIASQLKIGTHQPCMFLTRKTFDLGQQVVEYTESLGRGDKFEFSVELSND